MPIVFTLHRAGIVRLTCRIDLWLTKIATIGTSAEGGRITRLPGIPRERPEFAARCSGLSNIRNIFSFRQNGRGKRAMMASNPMMPMAPLRQCSIGNGCKPPAVDLLVCPRDAIQRSRS